LGIDEGPSPGDEDFLNAIGAENAGLLYVVVFAELLLLVYYQILLGGN
jgi:hypothetical protein